MTKVLATSNNNDGHCEGVWLEYYEYNTGVVLHMMLIGHCGCWSRIQAVVGLSNSGREHYWGQGYGGWQTNAMGLQSWREVLTALERYDKGLWWNLEEDAIDWYPTPRALPGQRR